MIRCPVCGRTFAGTNLGSHVWACDVTWEDLYWMKVDKRGPDECWPWTGRKDKSGYGRFDRKGPRVYAHRIAWTLANGPVPEGKDILHQCDNRWCCNPAHYFLGTQEDNNADAFKKRRHAWGERSRHAKLTAEQVKQIRASSGRKTDLAEQYGVKIGTIYAIVAGRIWRHL